VAETVPLELLLATYVSRPLYGVATIHPAHPPEWFGLTDSAPAEAGRK